MSDDEENEIEAALIYLSELFPVYDNEILYSILMENGKLNLIKSTTLTRQLMI